MSNISKSIMGVFKKSAKAFTNYPVVILNAILFTIVTIVRINLDWPVQEANNFLLNSLHLSFGLGAIFSLAAITYAQSRIDTKQSFLTANLLGVAVTVGAFLLLFFFGGIFPEKSTFETGTFKILHPLSVPRVLAAGFISSLAFVLFAGYPEGKSDFSKALFMTIKSFFIALVYGLVILAGASGVAGAIQALLYPEMSSKIYQYIATISGFVGFTIFVGYFPDFRKGKDDPHRETAQTQSRFIVVLLEFILVPIMLALTLVLILWAGQTILNGMDTQFVRLYGIATAYAIGGLVLHLLVTHSQSGVAKLYRRIFPVAVLFILLFEARALYLQLTKFGLKPTEYLFSVVWIIALASAILLLLRGKKAHHLIVYITSIAVIVAVLPRIGYGDLPVASQINRLEGLLSSQNMLRDNKIVPAKTAPDQATRQAITDSADFLINQQNVNYPPWLDKTAISTNFDLVMGFARAYPDNDPNQPIKSEATYLSLTPQAINVSGYQWVLTGSMEGKENQLSLFTGTKGKYELQWTGDARGSLTRLKVLRDGNVLIDQDFKTFFDELAAKYPTGGESNNAQLKDMSLKLESVQIDLLIIFSNVQIYHNAETGEIFYSYGIQTMLLNEK